jgi:hypothetical protein
LNRSLAAIGVWGMLWARYRKNGLAAFARMNFSDSSVYSDVISLCTTFCSITSSSRM